MDKALGLIEYKSIARGIGACDSMLKAGNVELLVATVYALASSSPWSPEMLKPFALLSGKESSMIHPMS